MARMAMAAMGSATGKLARKTMKAKRGGASAAAGRVHVHENMLKTQTIMQ